ncbi:MAG TPA: hypothetical protein DD730_18880 [Desulfosporosinus sp.]|nr:hypothetical protein [Desulfosporosinus sp.]
MPPEKVKKCLSRMRGKLSRTVLRRGKGSNPFSLVDYTSISFRKLLKSKELRQSTSRRGNCWDNAPQESFFGHMKDELHLVNCHSILDLKFEIDDYMDFYNNDRYQWGLAKLSPNQYALYLITGEYPIKIQKNTLISQM